MGMEPSFSASSVARSYDRLAAQYAQWADRVTPPLREHYAEVLSARLPAGTWVLELGCGPGVPVARMLSRRFAVVGVDISQQMVRLARLNAPRAVLLQADMASVAFRSASFDGVVAFYSLDPRSKGPPRRVAGPRAPVAASWWGPGRQPGLA
jgi:SAM-dependent methyltransferase